MESLLKLTAFGPTDVYMTDESFDLKTFKLFRSEKECFEGAQKFLMANKYSSDDACDLINEWLDLHKKIKTLREQYYILNDMFRYSNYEEYYADMTNGYCNECNDEYSEEVCGPVHWKILTEHEFSEKTSDENRNKLNNICEEINKSEKILSEKYLDDVFLQMTENYNAGRGYKRNTQFSLG